MKLNLSLFALAVLLTSCSSNPSRGPADTDSVGATDSTEQDGTDGTDATDATTSMDGTDATTSMDGTDGTASTDGTDGTEDTMGTDPPPPAGIPLLGNGKNSINYVQVAVVAGEEAGVVESVKAASDVYAPVDGEVKSVNDALTSEPGLINSSAEGDGWLWTMSISDESQLDGLMDADAYKTSIA